MGQKPESFCGPLMEADFGPSQNPHVERAFRPYSFYDGAPWRLLDYWICVGCIIALARTDAYAPHLAADVDGAEFAVFSAVIGPVCQAVLPLNIFPD